MSGYSDGTDTYTYKYDANGIRTQKNDKQYIIDINNNVVAVPESYHKGTLEPTDSFMYTDCDNVLISAVKRCEDGSGDMIIRLYETKGIDDSKGYLMSKLFDNGFWFDIKKHEIKTFRIDRETKVREINFLEGIVAPAESRE